VDENWDLLVNRVHLEKQLALVPPVLLFVLVLDPFLGTILTLIPIMLKKGIQQNHLVRHSHTEIHSTFLHFSQLEEPFQSKNKIK
jgi:hypothetical protein